MDDSTEASQFAERRTIWWAGVAVALVVTFVILGGLLSLATYLLAAADLLEFSYWPPAVVAGFLSVGLVRTAVKRGDSRYRPE